MSCLSSGVEEDFAMTTALIDVTPDPDGESSAAAAGTDPNGDPSATSAVTDSDGDAFAAAAAMDRKQPTKAHNQMARPLEALCNLL